MDAIFDRLALALNALLIGKMPDKDWKRNPCVDAGRTLADGWRLPTIMLRGDWEFFTQVCGVPTCQGVPNMCWLCHASPNLLELLWANGLANAKWRTTLRSHEQWLAELAAAGKPIPALFRILTLRLACVMCAVLHALDLGVTNHIIGNTMKAVMEKGHWGRTQDDTAAGFNKHLKQLYKQHKKAYKIECDVRYQRVKQSGDWPKFKAKAAATRHLADYVVDVACGLADGSADDVRMLAVIQGVARMYQI